MFDEGVKLAQSPEICLCLSGVLGVLPLNDLVVGRRERGKKRLSTRVADRVVRDAARRVHEIGCRWRRPEEVHAAIHLGRVQCPVGDTHKRLRPVSFVQQFVEGFEWHVRRELSQPDLVQQHHDGGVLGLRGEPPRVGKHLLDASARRMRGTLVGQHLYGRETPQELGCRALAAEVGVHEPQRQRL